MDRFLRGLLLDLDKRCQVLQGILRDGNFHQDLQSYSLFCYRQLEILHREVISLLGDPALGASALLQNQFQQYKRLAERLHLIESYPIPFIMRYQSYDHNLFLLSAALARQIHYPLTVPLVAALSHEYYWTIAGFNLIYIPAGEGEFLLGLSDLCHELGHILLLHSEAKFTFAFNLELLSYIRSEQQRVRNEQRPPDYHPFYERLFVAWKDRWTKEFVADIVATYIAGPAFGWQHLRLCAQMSQNIFEKGLESWILHPSDESRMRTILTVLRLLEHKKEADEIAEKWNQYVTLTGDVPPTDYRLCYPENLIHSLVNHVLNACRDIGLRPFTDTASDEIKPNLIAIMNRTWDEFFSNPESYSEWESKQVLKLFRLLVSEHP
jgi:hypothetical protein